MVFSSGIFLFVFLPIFLAVYYLLPARTRSATILVFSYLFYAWWRPDMALLLGSVTAGTYWLALLMDSRPDPVWRKRILTIAVVLNLATLAYFKYFNFGMSAVNDARGFFGMEHYDFARVLLPIGLSFYIFHAISYMVDIYRGEAKPSRNLLDFAAFIALFPHLVAGPVLRYHLLAEQFRSRVHNWSRFSRGCMLFMAGFCAKVLIADAVAPIANAAFEMSNPSMADSWIGALAYTLQLFFDFSGYSTMAIGLALMIGFDFPRNFNDPYISKSITEFWKRWHMSLSAWLREYLYIPLGGNRKGPVRTYINLLLTMVLGGLWHGANWTFIVWGAWHGGIMALERYSNDKYGPSRLPGVIQVMRTMLYVIIGWVIFRAATMHDAWRMLIAMTGVNGVRLGPELAWHITPDRVALLIIGSVLVYLLPAVMRRHGRWMTWLVPPLFLLAVATLSSQSFTPFLYFQF